MRGFVTMTVVLILINATVSAQPKGASQRGSQTRVAVSDTIVDNKEPIFLKLSVKIGKNGDTLSFDSPQTIKELLAKLKIDSDSMSHNIRQGMFGEDGLVNTFADLFNVFGMKMMDAQNDFFQLPLMQLGDSVSLFKFPGMERNIEMEQLGDSAKWPFQPGQPFFAPAMRDHGVAGAQKERRMPLFRRPRAEVAELTLSDLELLRKAGVKNKTMLQPSFNQADAVVKDELLMVSLTAEKQEFKNLEIMMLDENGAVVSKEIVRKASGKLERSFSIDKENTRILIIRDKNSFFARKIFYSNKK